MENVKMTDKIELKEEDLNKIAGGATTENEQYVCTECKKTFQGRPHYFYEMPFCMHCYVNIKK